MENKDYKLVIGSHVSLSAPEFLLGSVKEAIEYGSNALMVYTGAPQNTIRKPLDDTNIKQAWEVMKQNNISLDNLIVHAPYIINLCSENPSTRKLAVDFLTEEIKRCEQIGATILVLHPGSRLSQPLEVGIQQIIDGLNYVLNQLDTNVIICLETMAGKGSEVGCHISHLKQIIDGIKKQKNVGVCLDTCHLSDSGQDIKEIDAYLDLFDEQIGINKIKVVHLNDSKNPIDSHKDRHENIGYGYVGFENILSVVYHPKLNQIPKILETPYIIYEEDKKMKSCPPYKYEIKIIREKKWFDYRNQIINK